MARDEALFNRLQSTERSFGFHTGPDDVYLALRGLRSMAVRMERSFQSSLTIADWLKSRPEVGRILHPAHEGHPQNALFKRDFSGGCGLFSVELPGWDIPRSERFLEALEIFGMGFSWGGYESLAIHCDPQLKRTKTAQKHDGALIRFSIGMEAPEDLIADLEKGLAAAST